MPDRDRGFSLVETVIAIALMGVVVTTVLAGMRATVSASRIDRDHATSFVWLQAASDEIHQGPRESCTSGQSTAIAAYDALAKSAPRPPAWDGTSASIEVTNVEYLGRASVDDEFDWSPTHCFEGAGYVDSPLYTQRVTIEVSLPNGDSTETLEMVKSK